MFVVRTPSALAAIDGDRAEFGRLGSRALSGVVHAAPSTAVGACRAVLELQQNRGGVCFRALVGGEFVPADGTTLDWQVALWEAAQPVPQAGLVAKALLPGLPPEFGHAVASGLAQDLTTGDVPAGRLVIDRGGYDEESSPLLFMAAGRLLLRVLLAGAHGAAPEPVVESWVADRGDLPPLLPPARS